MLPYETSKSENKGLNKMIGRSVSFSDEVVTEVRLRPRTPAKEKRRLFYTCEETQRFRMEYRLHLRNERNAENNTVEQKSVIYSFMSFASDYISGLEVLTRASVKSNFSKIPEDINQVFGKGEASELCDVLYLY